MKTRSKIRKPSLYTLDFNVLDWDSLGEPVPDSQILWGNHSVSELVDILSPCTLEDIILGESFPDYLTFDITNKNDAYIRIKHKSRETDPEIDELISEWRRGKKVNNAEE